MSEARSDHYEPDEPLLPLPRTAGTTSDTEPPLNLSIEAIVDDVARFAQIYGLTHKAELLQKAAIIIQGETAVEDIPNITSSEIQVLRQEIEHKWRQPKTLYFTFLTCSIGAIVQGWVQTSANGATLYFPQQFGIGSDSAHDTFLVGLVNCGLFLSVALFGAWASAPINNRIGRRGAIFSGSILCLISTIGCSLTQTWQQLLAFRILLGAGLAINFTTVNVYAAECAPAAIRGGLAVSWQMWVAFGIFLGFVANVAVYNYGDKAWRYQLASPFIPTVPLLILVYFCPESPSWYIKNGDQYGNAFLSLRRLRNSELQAARDLYYIYVQQRVKGKAELAQRSRPLARRVLELFTIPRCRRAAMAAYVLMLSQQLCGINIMAFYSSSIFSDAGFSTYGALMASCAFGFVNFAFAFPAVWTMDSLGRRSLLLLTLPPMALTMLAAGLSFSIPRENPLHFWVLASLVYLFCALYSPGMGPVPPAYAAEVFPLSHREVGMSLAVATASSWATVLSLTFPRLLTGLRAEGTFALYSALNVLAFTLIFLFVPETKLRTLEELDQVFSFRTRDFVKYQVTEFLPWFIKRYILRQQTAELQPLIHQGDYRALEHEEDENI